MCYHNTGVVMLGKQGAYLITDETTRLYFTGYSSTDGYLLIIDENKYFIIDSRYFYAAKRALKGTGIKAVLGAFKEMIAILTESGKSELYVDYSKTTLAEAQELSLAGFRLSDCCEEIKEARIIKSEREIKIMERSCRIAERAFKMLIPMIKEGVTEIELATALENNFRALGAKKPSFETIVAFGANSAVPHHETGRTKLEKNTVVLIDFGCVYKGYCSDITRTMYFGDKPPKEFRSAYSAVYGAFNAAFYGIREGMSGEVCDSFARDYLKERGLDGYFTHSLGHGVGVDIHEEPTLSKRGKRNFLKNFVFTIEPGVYFDGKFGIRLENTVRLTENGVKSMVTLPKRLKVIKP